jgi:hypothetical protein
MALSIQQATFILSNPELEVKYLSFLYGKWHADTNSFEKIIYPLTYMLLREQGYCSDDESADDFVHLLYIEWDKFFLKHGPLTEAGKEVHRKYVARK